MDDITVIRSGRKTVALEIKTDGQVILRAPLAMREEEMRRFLQEKSAWLAKHLQLCQARRSASAAPKLTADEIQALAEKARAAIPPRVQYYAALLGVSYGRLAIRRQRTRWGSCSSRGNLNFNCLLMLAPPEVIDYTVVHELCHRKEMNHSAAFWALVASVLPDYPERAKWFKQHGGAILRRLPD